MRLPNVDRVEIDERKITGYLLSLAHSVGRGKAIFFRFFGFRLEEWTVLADALRQHAEENDVAAVEQTPFGTRYVVEGVLQTPSSRTPMVRVVWFIDSGSEIPRLVTAYPIEVADDDNDDRGT